MPQQPSSQSPSQVFAKNSAPTLIDAVGAITDVIATVVPGAKTAMQISKLSTAASTLNRLSDELTKEVAEIEVTLNALNLGVRAEVKATTLARDAEIGYCHWLNLAYGKKAGKWGFLVEELEETVADSNDEGSYESWLFKDAPREFRLQVIDSIPALLDALVKKSDDTANEITNKVKFVKDLASNFPKSSQQGPKK